MENELQKVINHSWVYIYCGGSCTTHESSFLLLIRKTRLYDCANTFTDYKQIVDIVAEAREQQPDLRQYQSKLGRLSIVKDNCHYVYREFSPRLHGKT